ncbi:MAG: hypothetical protein J3Q66DRAFT_424773 [Benniella sp.]|nr:MAG: hypothetical protein J3Q66DRAFT_424773 [Benniella sp.]
MEVATNLYITSRLTTWVQPDRCGGRSVWLLEVGTFGLWKCRGEGVDNETASGDVHIIGLLFPNGDDDDDDGEDDGDVLRQQQQQHHGGALLLAYPWRRRNALAPLEASSGIITSRTEDLRSYNVGPHQHALVPLRHRWSQYDCNVNDLVDYDIVVPESPPPETDVYPFPPRVDCRRETNAPSPSTVRCPSRSSLHSPALASAPTPAPAPLSFQPPYVYSSSGKDTDDEDDEDEANTSDMEKLSIQEQNHNEGGGGDGGDGGGDGSKRSRRPWTDSESAWLLECVEKHTKEIEAEVFRFAVRGKSWSRIAQLVGNGRTPTSCSNKYHKLMREH